MADPNTKINSSVGGPESATAQSSNAGEKGTSAGKGLAGGVQISDCGSGVSLTAI